MKTKISLETQQSLSLQILHVIDSFCKINNIEYFIGYGSLLGAVRHQGFIPWDDDVDIIMFRESYNKFIKLFNSVSKYPFYKCLSFENGDYYLPFTKVVDTRTSIVNERIMQLEDLGIAVDIFPYDYIADTYSISLRKKRKLTWITKCLRYSLFNSYREIDTRNVAIRTVYYVLVKTVGWKFWSKLLQKRVMNNISLEKTEYCGCLAYMSGNCPSIFRTAYFEKCETLSFVDLRVPVPGMFHEFLTSLYGDYHILPSLDERKPHASDAYFRGNSI